MSELGKSSRQRLGETFAVTRRRVHVGSCVDDGLGKVHYLLGSSLVGRRAEQVLAAARELKRRFGAVPEVVADGFAAIPAAHAHAARCLASHKQETTIFAIIYTNLIQGET